MSRLYTRDLGDGYYWIKIENPIGISVPSPIRIAWRQHGYWWPNMHPTSGDSPIWPTLKIRAISERLEPPFADDEEDAAHALPHPAEIVSMAEARAPGSDYRTGRPKVVDIARERKTRPR
jgi:hypothetical protein